MINPDIFDWQLADIPNAAHTLSLSDKYQCRLQNEPKSLVFQPNAD